MPEENRIFAKSRHQPTRTVQGGATLCKCMVYETVEFFIFQSKTMRTWSSDRKWFGLQRVQRRLTRTTSLTEVMLPCRTAPWTRPKPEVSAILFIPCRRRPLPQDLSSLSVWKSVCAPKWPVKQRWYAEQNSKMRRQDSSFCHMMDLCHLKNSELEKSS